MTLLLTPGGRLYDSKIGRFLSRDPLGGREGSYLYCDNNPVSYADPTGLCKTIKVKKKSKESIEQEIEQVEKELERIPGEIRHEERRISLNTYMKDRFKDLDTAWKCLKRLRATRKGWEHYRDKSIDIAVRQSSHSDWNRYENGFDTFRFYLGLAATSKLLDAEVDKLRKTDALSSMEELFRRVERHLRQERYKLGQPLRDLRQRKIALEAKRQQLRTALRERVKMEEQAAAAAAREKESYRAWALKRDRQIMEENEATLAKDAREKRARTMAPTNHFSVRIESGAEGESTAGAAAIVFVFRRLPSDPIDKSKRGAEKRYLLGAVGGGAGITSEPIAGSTPATKDIEFWTKDDKKVDLGNLSGRVTLVRVSSDWGGGWHLRWWTGPLKGTEAGTGKFKWRTSILGEGIKGSGYVGRLVPQKPATE